VISIKSVSIFKYFAFALLFICLYYTSIAQDFLYDWRSYTSMMENNSLSIDSQGRIWAGGVGGVYYYNPDNGDYREFRNTDGLLSTEVSVVRCDPASKRIFIGTYDGVLDIVTEDIKWKHITEIRSYNFPNPKINDIAFYNSKAFIAGDFGITVFNPDDEIFLETILKCGSFQQNTPVNAILIDNNKIFAATDEGLAVAGIDSQINDPASWKVYTAKNGLSEKEIIYIASNSEGEVFLASKTYLFKFEADTFRLIEHLTSGGEIYQGLQKTNDRFFYISNFALREINKDNSVRIYPIQHPDLLTGISFRSGQDYPQIILAYLKNGIGIINKSFDSTNHIELNTPVTNVFNDISIDKKGNLWVATGQEGVGRGIMMLRGEKWINFSPVNIPEMRSNSYHKILSYGNGKILASNWGYGFLTISEESNTFVFKRYDNTNSPLTTTVLPGPYIVVGEAAADNTGKLWLVDYGKNEQGPVLVSIEPNSFSFDSFINCRLANDRNYMSIAIDLNNTKWLGSTESKGLLYYNDRNTSSKSDDICGIISSSDYPNLFDNTQNTLAVDKNGWLWIGTETGLSILHNPSFIFSNSKPILRKETKLSQMIKDILVDALNNKWIATNTGVWIIDNDSEVHGPINKDNSPLITNEILSLGTNEETGEIYIGTAKGLFVAKSHSIKPVDDFKIYVSPQPFNPEKDEQLIIDGLAEESDVRILTLNGELVKSLVTRSRQVVWDGKDSSGNPVSSGIYIISGISATTNKTGVGKIAVIRK
jgi:ligand-binding sensor domain-containing protein